MYAFLAGSAKKGFILEVYSTCEQRGNAHFTTKVGCKADAAETIPTYNDRLAHIYDAHSYEVQLNEAALLKLKCTKRVHKSAGLTDGQRASARADAKAARATHRALAVARPAIFSLINRGQVGGT